MARLLWLKSYYRLMNPSIDYSQLRSCSQEIPVSKGWSNSNTLGVS